MSVLVVTLLNLSLGSTQMSTEIECRKNELFYQFYFTLEHSTEISKRTGKFNFQLAPQQTSASISSDHHYSKNIQYSPIIRG